MNEEELRNLMYTATLEKNAGPFSIRYPRGNGMMIDWRKPFGEIAIGTGRTLRKGDKIALLAIGHPGNFALKAAETLAKEGVEVGVYDMRFVKPLDERLLHEICSQYKHIITIEDGTIVGGFGSAILEFMAAHDYKLSLKMLGMPDKITEHGEQNELYAECGFDEAAIAKATKAVLAEDLVSSHS
jgi:1-deoxy-D-xylulose-5-phosphate synthase